MNINLNNRISTNLYDARMEISGSMVVTKYLQFKAGALV